MANKKDEIAAEKMEYHAGRHGKKHAFQARDVRPVFAAFLRQRRRQLSLVANQAIHLPVGQRHQQEQPDFFENISGQHRAVVAGCCSRPQHSPDIGRVLAVPDSVQQLFSGQQIWDTAKHKTHIEP